jgi:acid phosphatase class B
MSTFLKTALTATLAVSVLLILAGSKLVRAETSPSINNGSEAIQLQNASPATHASIRSTVRYLAEPLQNSFDPEPNDPPKGTGGSGSR